MSTRTPATPDPEKPAAPAPPDVPPLEAFFKGRRPLAAAALLVLLEAVPIAGMVLAFRENSGVWMILSGAIIAGALLPPVGVLLHQKWGYVLGQYVVWASLVGVVLRALHFGFNMVYLAPAVLLGVLLVALSPPRGAGDSPRKSEKKPESFGVWLKENIEAIVIAFIMALVIRCFCIEVFKIPSSSMEPTLLGDIGGNHARIHCTFGPYHVPIPKDNAKDNASGDRIMVTKYYYSFSPVERYDVLVFKFPLNQAKNFIKRVVGLPDEWIQIHRGNLYTAKEKKGPYQIARRTLRTQDSIWIDPAKGSPGYLVSPEIFNTDWLSEKPPDRKGAAHVNVQDGVLSTQEKDGERSALFSYNRGGQKYLDDGGSTAVDDVRIQFEFELTSPKGQVFAEVVNAYGRFEARLDTDGESQLICQLPVKDSRGKFKTETWPLKDVRLTSDRFYKLELAIFDGTAVVRLNDGERGKFNFITQMDHDKDTERFFVPVAENPEYRIAFGARGATFKVRNLSLGRDIYYKGRPEREHGLAEDHPEQIPPGEYLMMGDNVANSHDSRAWVKRTFRLKPTPQHPEGKLIVCESQQVNEGSYKVPPHLRDSLNLNDVLYWIDGDEHGNELPILKSEFDKEEKSKEFRFVPEKYIVGKALWIWWPQGRWFHLIR